MFQNTFQKTKIFLIKTETLCQISYPEIQWQIQGFPEGGTNLLYGQFLSKTAWKWRNFGPEGSTQPSHPIDPPMQIRRHHFIALMFFTEKLAFLSFSDIIPGNRSWFVNSPHEKRKTQNKVRSQDGFLCSSSWECLLPATLGKSIGLVFRSMLPKVYYQ